MRNEIMYLRWERNFAIAVAVLLFVLAVHQCRRANEERIVKEELITVLGNMYEPVGGE